MGLFEFFKVYQASEFNGVLTEGGKPLSGVTLERKVEENSDYVTTQKTQTDENGKFNFPSVYRYGLARFSIAEDRYFQHITFKNNGSEITAFHIAKSGVLLNDEFSFLEGKKGIRVPMNFECDLETKDEGEMYKTSVYSGICRLKI